MFLGISLSYLSYSLGSHTYLMSSLAPVWLVLSSCLPMLPSGTATVCTECRQSHLLASSSDHVCVGYRNVKSTAQPRVSITPQSWKIIASGKCSTVSGLRSRHQGVWRQNSLDLNLSPASLKAIPFSSLRLVCSFVKWR